jgi:crotonobetainyl-CoA:carnitine CoA-transferase CaiB-like acyl-CoA transferase
MQASPPYAGLRVLDVSQGLAGPYCAGLLGMQGASVIKVEPPDGDWIRNAGSGREGMTSLAVMGNPGKRSACIDATKPEGKALILRMARTADVFVQNFRPGVIERLGLGYETLAADHPALVYVSISGFGASGPEVRKAATDSVLQAFTGMANINRDIDGTPRRIPFLIPDTVTGVYAAQAVGAALFARATTGQGRHVEVSLMDACAALQAAPILDAALSDGRPVAPITVPSGIFRTRDGISPSPASTKRCSRRYSKSWALSNWARTPGSPYRPIAKRMLRWSTLKFPVALSKRTRSTGSRSFPRPMCCPPRPSTLPDFGLHRRQCICRRSRTWTSFLLGRCPFHACPVEAANGRSNRRRESGSTPWKSSVSWA